MPNVSIFIPQIGEGLQEARVVAFLKKPGDVIRRDEPIYQMETDKAVMDVESPVDGVLASWAAAVDDIVPIGSAIGIVEVSDGVEAPTAPSHGAPTAPVAASGTAPLYIPQIGEGLQEARIVAFLKQAGDLVKRDEPIYQMETDKAVMDVESPSEGALVEWFAAVDDVVPIGFEVGRMSVSEGVEVAAAPSHGAPAVAPAAKSAPVASKASGDVRGIPPRTRAYAKEKGISDDVLVTIPFSGSKLMPTDIDAFQTGGSQSIRTGAGYSESALPSKQRVLNSRMVRSNSLVVPGTITVVTDWSAIETERTLAKQEMRGFQPSAFTMFAYAVVRAMAEFPTFRSALAGDDKLRTYDHVSLGIAVSLPGDELVTAVVDKADTLSWAEFAAAARAQIELARGGKDQAHAGVTVSLTNMQAFGLRDAVPVVVAPSMATIFLGEVFNGLDSTPNMIRVKRLVNVSMTFDHRIANGVGASLFINKIRENVESISDVLG
ncbi:MAG: 2-oxo acid dehydrogenase subunit E2 [Fimbriimonas sp.]|nr:2-oxo acid dehydrogenase subunit E2 [Fimbriimonas sp.]